MGVLMLAVSTTAIWVIVLIMMASVIISVVGKTITSII